MYSESGDMIHEIDVENMTRIIKTTDRKSVV